MAATLECSTCSQAARASQAASITTAKRSSIALAPALPTQTPGLASRKRIETDAPVQLIPQLSHTLHMLVYTSAAATTSASAPACRPLLPHATRIACAHPHQDCPRSAAAPASGAASTPRAWLAATPCPAHTPRLLSQRASHQARGPPRLSVVAQLAGCKVALKGGVCARLGVLWSLTGQGRR